MNLWLCSVVGLGLTAFLVYITEYYTGTQFAPVKHVAEASTKGHATNIIAGIGVRCAPPRGRCFAVCLAIYGAYTLSGLYGIAIAATSMPPWLASSSRWTPTAPSPTTPAASPKCPGCRNPCATSPTRSTRWATPPRPSLRATPSVRLVWPLVLFADYTHKLEETGRHLTFDLSDPAVIIGLSPAA